MTTQLHNYPTYLLHDLTTRSPDFLTTRTDSVTTLLQLPEVPLVKRGPRRLEKNQLKVELEAGAKEYVVAEERQVEPQRQQRLVHHRHQVVVKSRKCWRRSIFNVKHKWLFIVKQAIIISFWYLRILWWTSSSVSSSLWMHIMYSDWAASKRFCTSHQVTESRSF